MRFMDKLLAYAPIILMVEIAVFVIILALTT